MTLTKPAANYTVATSWNPVSGATGYNVALSNATTGASIANVKVTSTTWSVSRTLKPGDTLKLTVRAMVGKRSGKWSVPLTRQVPDLTPPTGSYTVAHKVDSKDATVTGSATDDSGAIVNSVITWGDGKSESWPVGAASMTHTYPAGKKVYYPTVTLSDQAVPPNTFVLNLDAVAIDDTEKPTASQGAFKSAPGKAWAKYTVVTVTQVGTVSDDLSQPKNIKRTIHWGDKTTSVVRTGGMTAKHVYATAGSFTPTVTLTDEAKRVSDPIALSTVTVKADTTKPVATLVKPRLRRNAVRSWIRLHGRATDVNGTGVRDARVRIIERRAGAWFAYRAGTKTWVKAGTKAGALKRSRPAVVHPTRGTWVYRVRGLRKGTLIVKVWGSDNVGNTSTPLVYKQRLTRR